jgi:hypothetical protein
MIQVKRQIHQMYTGWQLTRHLAPDLMRKPLIGKYQYLYFKNKLRISLVELPDYLLYGKDVWEICGGGLTEDVERFDSKEEAEVRIKELLQDRELSEVEDIQNEA